MKIPFLTKWFAAARDRASIAENARMRYAQLQHDWNDADRRHKIALAEHGAACRRHVANPTAENFAATRRYYERTWEPYNECFEIWRELRRLRF
jgi:hypothetical protein